MSYTTPLRWGLIIGVCAIPFISFLVASGGLIPNMFFPFITGKNFAFRILVEVLLAAYVILAIKDPKYRPKASLLMWSALAFLGWMALATVFSVDPIKSFWSNFERMDGYITLIHLFAMFVVAGAVLGAEKWWEKFFRVSVVASVCMGIYGVLQLAGVFSISSQSGPRIDTTFGNATYLAVFMLINIFLTLFLLVRDRKSVGLQVLYGDPRRHSRPSCGPHRLRAVHRHLRQRGRVEELAQALLGRPGHHRRAHRRILGA
jgi:hypothetical protein